MSGRALFDPGLQPERTDLAWRRTALAIAAASLVSLRAFPLLIDNPRVGILGVVPGIVGLMLAAGMVWRARLRYSRFLRSTEARRPQDAGGGALLLTVAGFVAMGAICSFVLVLVSVLR